MGKENIKYMPNEEFKKVEEVGVSVEQKLEEIVESSDFDPELLSKNISRNFCVLSADFYSLSSESAGDPGKAIKEVNLSGIDEEKIQDSVVELVTTAAKIGTAIENLSLTPKQKEHYRGVEQNVNGLAGFLSSIPDKVKRGVVAVTLAFQLSQATGCSFRTPEPVIANPNLTSTPTTEISPRPPLVEEPPVVISVTPAAPVPGKTETPTVVVDTVVSYPTTADNFILTEGLSGSEARTRIEELGAGGDLSELEKWYETEGIIGSGQSNFVIPVVFEAGGKVSWNLLVKKNNGHFYKFTITDGSEAGQTVRAMGMVNYSGTKPSFEVSELTDPEGGEGVLEQRVIWDKSGWNVIGAFQGDTLVAWFNADAPDGGTWEKINEVVPTITLTETKTVAEETSRYFQPEFQLDLEGTVDGITIPFTLGLHKSVIERAEEPIKTISVNREDAPELYAKFWLTICWQKYIQQNPSQAGISFTQYEELVKNKGGEIQVAAVDENTDDQNNKILTFHPEKGFIRMLVDNTVQLPEEGNTLSSFYFGMNQKGQLIIADDFLWSQYITEQRGYDGWEGWKSNDLVDLVVSGKIAEGVELIISTNNEALISQTSYWKVAGIVNFPDRELFFDPMIHDIQFSERNPLLTIQK